MHNGALRELVPREAASNQLVKDEERRGKNGASHALEHNIQNRKSFRKRRKKTFLKEPG